MHFEVDLPNGDHEIPVDTTGEATLDVGKPEPATEVPLYAASVRGKNGSRKSVRRRNRPRGSTLCLQAQRFATNICLP